MSSVKALREVVQRLAETFNNPQNRESSYFDLAIALIDRMKKLFSSTRGLTATTFDSKETVIELNNVKIEAFPSHH
jgi:hypothetical protein